MNNDERPTPPGEADEFDARMRCELARATPVGTIPQSVFRVEPRWRLPTLAIRLFAVVGILVASFQVLQPPTLVRAALAHERNERTVRSNLMPPQTTIAGAFGLPAGAAAPGLLQMAKPCVIAGRVAYHLTTWIDGAAGGIMVTAISLRNRLPSPSAAAGGPILIGASSARSRARQ
ncbi:MAG: hypothetical protein NVSMB6_16550 [Burkholderiaceae bacterium]